MLREHAQLLAHGGDSASYTTSARRLGWIAVRGPDRGTAKVYVDGVHAGGADLYSPYLNPRRVVWQWGWSTARPHTIRIEVASGRVDIDAFTVLR